MKLLLCLKCNEIFNLTQGCYRECRGKHCGGKYTDELNAKVWGDPAQVFVLGFANSTLGSAIRNQVESGDLPPTLGYGRGVVSPGRPFTAFIIPDSADSVERTLDKGVDW